MILYHTSQRADLFRDPSDRDPTTAARLWFDATHFVFATEPLSGLGPWVYEIDIPSNTVERYMFTNIHRRERSSHYALPWQMVVDNAPQLQSYEDLTGSDWKSWEVTVLDKHPRPRDRNHMGMWGLVWASREGVARVRMGERTAEKVSVLLELTSEFDARSDYIVVEEHDEFDEGPSAPAKETWALFTLAGQSPRWQLFPSEWQEWVNDPKVTESAMRYLHRQLPELVRDMEYAQSLESKHNRVRAWRNIGDQISNHLSRTLRRDVDLGKFAGNSWTAVLAVPLRIAKRLGAYVGEEWVPPSPQPEFQHPDASGRVLLANNYGAYPKQGPGVDHAPQDRPHEKRSSELRRPSAPPPPGRRFSGDPSTSSKPRW